jgi:uncharacterized protein YndB with AHSA1/START domain
MSQQPLVIESVYQVRRERVWEALIDPDQIKQWYFDLPGFKAVLGYEFGFTGLSNNQRPYHHLCRVTEVVASKKLAYTWRYEGYPGNSTVVFELFAEGEKTRLKLTHTGLSNFDQANPDFARTNFEQGWNYILKKSLDGFLETHP